MTRRTPACVARGTPVTKIKRKTFVNFDHDTFEAVRIIAVRDGVSFAEVIRTLVEWGLEAIEEPAE